MFVTPFTNGSFNPISYSHYLSPNSASNSSNLLVVRHAGFIINHQAQSSPHLFDVWGRRSLYTYESSAFPFIPRFTNKSRSSVVSFGYANIFLGNFLKRKNPEM